MVNYKQTIYILIAALLLISFLHIPEADAARTPNLIIVKVSPHYNDPFSSYHKYVQGYSVEVANYGSGASKATTMDFYIRTYDGKSLKKTIPIKAMNAGKIIRVTFSMNAGTDGSLKDGYAIVNPKKTFKEISFKDNLKRFGLKDTMLKSDVKNVTEYYYTQSGAVKWSGTTTNYTSPLSNNTSINRIDCTINFNLRFKNVGYIEAQIPGYMHDNVTMTAYSWYTLRSGHPTSWNDTHCRFNVNAYYDTFNYANIKIVGENLETKNAMKEPIIVTIGSYVQGELVYVDGAENRTRYIDEYYSSIVPNQQSYTYTTASSYNVHHSNVYKLQVTGNPRKFYCAGWQINPSATSISKVTGVYGSELQNSRTASKINTNTWGVNQKIRDINRMGFIIEGNNIKGFSNFKTLGFNSWTWRELY